MFKILYSTSKQEKENLTVQQLEAKNKAIVEEQIHLKWRDYLISAEQGTIENISINT